MSEIDLETGNRIGGSARDRQRAAKSGSGSASKSTPSRAQQSEAHDIKSSLKDTFNALADTFEARGDNTLAEIFREENEVMSRGLVDLTKGLTFLRTPLVVALAVVRPVLSFGRLGRELWQRNQERRVRNWEASQAAEAEANGQPVGV